jgi:hypothetical protein
MYRRYHHTGMMVPVPGTMYELLQYYVSLQGLARMYVPNYWEKVTEFLVCDGRLLMSPLIM